MYDCQKEIIELLLTNGAHVRCEDKTTGTTALQMAIIRGNLNTAQLLVQHGADTKTLSKVSTLSNRTVCPLKRTVSFSIGRRKDPSTIGDIHEQVGKLTIHDT
jgi:ankyrin repeat protein